MLNDLQTIALRAVAAAELKHFILLLIRTNGDRMMLSALYETVPKEQHSQMLGCIGEMRRQEVPLLLRTENRYGRYYTITTAGRAELERAAQEGL